MDLEQRLLRLDGLSFLDQQLHDLPVTGRHNGQRRLVSLDLKHHLVHGNCVTFLLYEPWKQIEGIEKGAMNPRYSLFYKAESLSAHAPITAKNDGPL